MKVSRNVLKAIFALKGNFSAGKAPSCRLFAGVEIAPFLGGAPASATISADFELAWAFRSRSDVERLALAQQTRKNLPCILQVLEDYDVPITWATVGHLFLESCERGPDGSPHHTMRRPPKNVRWNGDWYRHDPCADVYREPAWYAPDLIQAILASPVRHEIGSHSFSHIDFSPNTCTAELVESEMVECSRVMQPWALRPRSLVYPFNSMGNQHLPLLARLGITSVRHRDPRIRLSYPVKTPSGVYLLVESMNLRQAAYYAYPEKASIFLEEAARRSAAYHLWFHPSDSEDLFRNEFTQIVKELSTLQSQGRLWLATMSQLAAYCEARDRTTLVVERLPTCVKIRVHTAFDSARYGDTQVTLKLPSGTFVNVPALDGYELELPAWPCCGHGLDSHQ